jgi:Pyrroline-5-carboxylate reductase
MIYMRQIAIYGAGHLTKSFLKGLSRALPDKEIKVYNRTSSKVDELKEIHPGVIKVDNSIELLTTSSIVFLIIPPAVILELPTTFAEVAVKNDSVIVSCANYLSLGKLDATFPSVKMVRLLPNIHWQMQYGISIFAAGTELESTDIKELKLLLGNITELVDGVSDDVFDKIGKLTSCGPGLFSKIVSQLTEAFCISDESYKLVVYKTIAATMNYLLTSGKSPEQVIGEVANKGGLTESGVSAADAMLGDVFVGISRSMDARLVERKQKLER